ncbi:hypothetical protein AB4144_51760 [Rhizobiaceae sp. 2RAB30]
MSTELTIKLDEEMSDALDRMIVDMQLEFRREVAATAMLRDWLIAAGYLPDDLAEVETPSDREA